MNVVLEKHYKSALELFNELRRDRELRKCYTDVKIEKYIDECLERMEKGQTIEEKQVLKTENKVINCMMFNCIYTNCMYQGYCSNCKLTDTVEICEICKRKERCKVHRKSDLENLVNGIMINDIPFYEPCELEIEEESSNYEEI